jgi:DNA (cytosine-5)-methyltransferase 1
LENVKGLVTHDNGKTLDVILNTLEELDYAVHVKIINAKNFGVPQNRERIFIIGFNKDKVDNYNVFNFPESTQEVFINNFIENNVEGYDISEHLQKSYLLKKDDGKPQIIDINSNIQVKTLVSTYHKIQRLTGTFVKDGKTGLRLLSISECKAIMGFPNDFIVPVSRTQAYRQFGNSVAVPAIQATANEILKN